MNVHTPESIHDTTRPVGEESRKTYADKVASGFLDKYLSGAAILEIGFKGYIDGAVPIVPQAIGIDLDYPGYDGINLPFGNETQDCIYSSHCFEHIADYKGVLREWYRLLKVGGYMIIVVPHQYLFERRAMLPSLQNPDHKRFYTPSSLLREIEETFSPNSYRIRHLADNDKDFTYSQPPREPAFGCYEIELVIEKIYKPGWNLDDGTVRPYSAGEFYANGANRPEQWSLSTDFSQTDRCLIFGPYVKLESGNYEVEYCFQSENLSEEPLQSELMFDVAQNGIRISAVTLIGDDGNRILRSGSCKLLFYNNEPGAVFEFRVFASGRPFDGSFIFKGVVLRPYN